ncbi:MAG TPA: antitoxin Xre/MbcA/ParS toxin-binding domain-containing protein [Candidatus Acidoferrales bacterium]|nr:antitoxin Xre/MbcA/ParS toxin-binding domain-containing protein [Candidatus Acidoferrales bacterium]
MHVPVAVDASASIYEAISDLLDLHPTARSELDLAARVEEGLPATVVARLRGGAGLDDAEISALIGNPRTLTRRRVHCQPLSIGESERAVRIARISVLARETFAARPDYALEWLRTPKRALNDRAPLAAAATDPGARAVEELLVSLQEGMFG